MRPLLLTSLLALSSATLVKRQGADPWTAAIGNDKCTSECGDKVVGCSVTGACAADSADMAAVCTVDGFNKIVACANCVISAGLVSSVDANQVASHVRMKCGPKIQGDTAAITAGSGSGGALSTPPSQTETVTATGTEAGATGTEAAAASATDASASGTSVVSGMTGTGTAAGTGAQATGNATETAAAASKSNAAKRAVPWAALVLGVLAGMAL